MHPVTLTPDAMEALPSLTSDASDYVGRTVSGSAVVRAMLRHVEQQPVSWAPARILPSLRRSWTAGSC